MVIESLLTWLSSLEDDDRVVYLGALNSDEKELCYQLLRDFYLNRPEAKRQRSVREAMILFNQAFLAKSKLWVERRWDPIANLIGVITDALTRRALDTKDSISTSVSAAIGRERDIEFDAILTLRRIVQLIEIFDFSGVTVLIVKVDETDATNNSAEKTAELIYPLLARIQLLEIDHLSWVFFLWNRVKTSFEGGKFPVRLDKIGHATVSWSDEFFSLMLDKRVEFFSDGRLNLMGLFVDGSDGAVIRRELTRVSMRSPREMIRLMDVIVREHDVMHAVKDEIVLLDQQSVQLGIDSYVTDRIAAIYGERLLAQIFRLNKTTFSNRDVQLTFRVGAQSARTRIQSWESAGIIKFSGTRAAEGPLGGKPANEYTIVDARIERIMQRQLIKYQTEVEPEETGTDKSEPDELN
ncbi:MAG: hypothetical protein WB715_05850 [Roseiarcus sp.]|uniref:hypothetical protein n=1 Tax=Roseiarcus sp. TaxID=1969460 RepID=UPI003C3BE45D